MRILLVGSNKGWSIEKFYYHHLSEACTVQLFAAQNLLFDYLQRGLANKVLYRLGLSGAYRMINKQLKEAIEHFQPDVLFVFKGMEVLPSTLKWAKAKEIKLANYNPDNPFIFSSRGSGNANVSASIGLYDFHFTYDQAVKAQLNRQFNLPVAILPFGFELSDQVFQESAYAPEINKVCFIGNPDQIRASFIRRLAQSGIDVDVFGNGWTNYLSHPNISCNPAIGGNEFWYKLRQYRVQLNLLRPHNLTSHNMRTFEIGGVGGIQLAPDTEDHRRFFAPEKEIFLFTDFHSCSDQVNKLLSLNEVEALELRINARKKSLEENYCYERRANQVREALEALVGTKCSTSTIKWQH